MLTRKARLSVKTKIYAGLAVIVLFGVLSMLFIYRGLGAVKQQLDRLDQVEVPFLAAAYEMEVNSDEHALEVLKYLAHPHPEHRAEARDDSADFAQYLDTYLHSSSSERKRELGRELGERHQRFVAMGETMMQMKDEQEQAFEQTTELLEEIDAIVDQQLPRAMTGNAGLRSRAQAAIADMEAEAAEIGFWLATYQRRQTPVARQRIFEKLAEFDDALSAYRELPLTAAERRLSAQIEAINARMAAAVRELLSNEDTLAGLVKEFIDYQVAIDDVIDDQVQKLALENLALPRRDADKATERVLATLRVLIPTFALVALLGGLLLALAIIRPLRRLTLGTEAVAKGDLNYRIEALGNDEFGRLGGEFNHMMTRLQQTTVSKGALQVSESKLRATVAELRQEIAERERSEREQQKLRHELQRSEAMAAIGSLMAGVAHEVRNPLFGISSTLDAMEVQSEPHGKDGRYRRVLRREVDRLNKLMHDLLEYGRPPTDKFATGELRRVIREAVQICTPKAESAGVVIVDKAVGADSTLQLNHGRLLQVFVNLIENAIQHAPAGSEVAIDASTVRDDDGQRWVECTVEDAGAGFAPQDLPSIFDPFFSRRRGGTGLGLPIVQRIVEEHRGSIAAANRPSGGALMTVRLPIAAD